ncbi:hypothetical protein Ddc_19217 [Ditylenchus destructor]|nr:hypothetical protein Ddc_19217 [Ditylenchus destructor]
MDLKNSGESQLVEAIEGKIRVPAIELFKRDYAEFIVKEERNEDDDSTEQVFEFVNNDIGKKLQLTAETYDEAESYFSIKINNL